MSPEVLFELVPASFPMTHKIEGCDLVARCPVDHWERSGRKACTVQSWREPALKIAKNGEENLRAVMKVAREELNNEDSVGPGDSAHAMLDGTEIFAAKFGYPRRLRPASPAAASERTHWGLLVCQEETFARCLGVLL
eukprot:1984660-Pyramimonas_sp.AAC.1